MQFKTFKVTLLSLFILTSFVGCGEGSSSTTQKVPSASDTTPQTKIINKIQDPLNAISLEYKDLFKLIDTQNNTTALIIDAHGVEGLSITCGSQHTKSKQYGLFTCNKLPIIIYLGNFKIGTLTKIPKDKIIYTQDILHLPRAATMHPDVTKLSMILQSLDENADLSNGIKITQESMNLLDNELVNYSDIQHLSIENTNDIIESVIAARKSDDTNAKLTKVPEKEAQINLTKALSNTPAKNLNITSFHSITL